MKLLSACLLGLENKPSHANSQNKILPAAWLENITPSYFSPGRGEKYEGFSAREQTAAREFRGNGALLLAQPVSGLALPEGLSSARLGWANI